MYEQEERKRRRYRRGRLFQSCQRPVDNARLNVDVCMITRWRTESMTQLCRQGCWVCREKVVD
jgi:hypothetical protein